MIKKHLLGGALLVSVLVLLTGCKEMMSSLDNPVDSYFKLTETSKTIYRGQSYKIEYSTISDAKPIFKSADEKIAIVDENGVITGANRGTTKISVTLPATDYYNGASAEFTVEVDALLNIPKDAKELALNEVYNLGVTSVSTGAITYKSSNTKVATVDADGNVTAKAYGDATITISIAATPQYDRTETAEFAAKVRVFDFDQLKAAVAASDEPFIYLADNVSIDVTNDINLAGKTKPVIKGNKENPATLVFKSKSIVIDGGLTLSDVIIDANSSGHFIKGYSDTTKETVDGHIIVKDPVLIEGVTIKNLKKAFFYDNTKSYLFENFKINNCIVHLKKEGNVVINFEKSTLVQFTISNSTFYVDDTTGDKNFIAVNSSKRPWEITGYESAECRFDCDHNTFYNVAKAKQFFNTNRLKGQNKYKYYMNSNIFVNSSNKKIYGNMTNNKNQVIPDGKNTYWFDGVAFSETGYNGDEGLQTDPNLKDPANAIFTPLGADQAANQTGDPRWYRVN